MTTQVQPIEVRVVWHPKDKVKRSGAPSIPEQLFMLLHLDPSLPSAERLGMPVWFHCGKKGTRLRTELPPRLPLRSDQRTADETVIVVLAGDAFVAEDEWIEWGRLLRKQAEEDPSVHFVGIALTEKASNNDALFGRLNRERAFAETYLIERDRLIRIAVLRTLARRLGDGNKVRVFVSHAKADGSDIAKALGTHLDTYKTDAWLDVQQIEGGDDFERVLSGAIEDTAFVAVVTDVYATRDWCRWEAQLAKERSLPTVALDLVSAGQRRSLASLGNIPVVRLNVPARTANRSMSRPALVAYNRVTEAVLLELLASRYFPRVVAALKERYGQTEEWLSFSTPPELMSLASRRDELEGVETAVYPDPPLPAFEVSFLQRFGQGAELATPLSLLPAVKEGQLPGSQPKRLRVGISISQVDPERARQRGTGELHLQALFFHICRQVLAAGHSLIYGGDPTLHGFVTALGDLERAYRFSDDGERRITNYVADYLASSAAFRAEDLNDAMRVIPVERLRAKKEPEGLRAALDLTAMRERMHDSIDVRIVIGGDLTPSKRGTRRSPGVVEEAYIDAVDNERKVPLLIAGGPGGAGELLASAVAGALDTTRVAHIEPHFTPLESDLLATDRPVTFREMIESIGPGALAGNGLSTVENAELLGSHDADVIVTNVVLALHRLAHDIQP